MRYMTLLISHEMCLGKSIICLWFNSWLHKEFALGYPKHTVFVQGNVQTDTYFNISKWWKIKLKYLSLDMYENIYPQIEMKVIYST